MIHPIYFMVRRFMLSFVVVFIRSHLIWQIFAKAMMIIIAVNLIGHVEALHTKERQLLEYINEVIIMQVLYTMICFSPFVPEIETRYLVGFWCIVLVSFHLILNMSMICYASLKRAKFDIQLWFAKKKLTKFRAKKRSQMMENELKRKYYRRARIKAARKAYNLSNAEKVASEYLKQASPKRLKFEQDSELVSLPLKSISEAPLNEEFEQIDTRAYTRKDRFYSKATDNYRDFMMELEPDLTPTFHNP